MQFSTSKRLLSHVHHKPLLAEFLAYKWANQREPSEAGSTKIYWYVIQPLRVGPAVQPLSTLKLKLFQLSVSKSFSIIFSNALSVGID